MALLRATKRLDSVSNIAGRVMPHIKQPAVSIVYPSRDLDNTHGKERIRVESHE
jgi:hypothetical protein